jgi:hypothetical protein
MAKPKGNGVYARCQLVRLTEVYAITEDTPGTYSFICMVVPSKGLLATH